MGSAHSKEAKSSPWHLLADTLRRRRSWPKIIKVAAAKSTANKKATTSHLSAIPLEIGFEIMKWLHPQEVLKFRRLSRKMNESLSTKHFAIQNLLNFLPKEKTQRIDCQGADEFDLLLPGWPQIYQREYIRLVLSHATGIQWNYSQFRCSKFPCQLAQIESLEFLDLSYSKLDGSIPESFRVAKTEHLSQNNLKILRLHGNRLSGHIPSSIGSFVGLEKLNLMFNTLEGSIPSTIGRLVNLKALYLNGNRLSGPIPQEIGNLLNLEELYLNKNQFSSKLPETLTKLSKLRKLDLSSNCLSGSISAKVVSGLVGLVELQLANNEFTGQIPKSLGSLPNLKDISLSCNGFSGHIPAELGHSSSVEYIYLDHNNLTGNIPDELRNCASLRGLRVSENNLDGRIPVGLSNLAFLREIHVNGNCNLALPKQEEIGSDLYAWFLARTDALLNGE